MAEFLFLAKSATHRDPVKDRVGCHKRGNFQDARRDGFTWGRKEGPPLFTRVILPRLNWRVARARYAGEHVVPSGDIEIPFEVYRRHRWTLLDTEMPPELVAKVFPALYEAGGLPMFRIRPRPSDVGTFDMTWEDFRKFFWDHKSQSRETRGFADSDIFSIIV